MMIRKKYIVIALGVVSILLGSLLVNNVLLAQSGGEYDPWIDTNYDGIIDVNDLQALGSIYGTSGEAINKTELLLDLLDRVETIENQLLPLGYIMLPAYDSGLHEMTSTWMTLTHNLNRTTVFVYLVGYHPSSGYHIEDYGHSWGWRLLTRNTIEVYKWPGSTYITHLRVRIWILI